MAVSLIIAALLAWSTLAPHANPGTFAAITQPDNSVLRMDTRSGTFERCALVADTVECKPVSVPK